MGGMVLIAKFHHHIFWWNGLETILRVAGLMERASAYALYHYIAKPYDLKKVGGEGVGFNYLMM